MAAAETRRLLLMIASCCLALPSFAGPFVQPGDTLRRHDLQLLDDAGLINRPLTTWPLSWADIDESLAAVDPSGLTDVQLLALERLRRAAERATTTGRAEFRGRVAVAGNPRIIRGFSDEPREEGNATLSMGWTGTKLATNLSVTAVTDPDDGEEIRADGSFAGIALGNWMVSAGWQEHWWGPGRDGSLILSTNARPLPALAVQRNRSRAFESRWLSWIGPWTLTAFVGVLDDERAIDDALLLGLRAAFRPHPAIEIGLSRGAQLCGEGRPCGASEFVDLLLGNDNKGINVDPEEEPGNQLAGFDVRWSLPAGLPVAVYAQWIGEDTRRGGPEIGSWLRLAGIEAYGSHHGSAFRSYLEVAETSCRDGGLGFSELVANCAYEHGIYRTGYRYRGRAIGHGVDGDGRAFTLGTTLVQSDGSAWEVDLRLAEINRAGVPDSRHSLSAIPRDQWDIQVSRTALGRLGRLQAALGFRRIENGAGADSENEVTGFIQWSSW